MLTISASEWRVESITLDGESKLALGMAFPGMAGDVLSLRDIEQGMEQLNRLPSQQVSIDIQPGAHAGYSRVVLQRSSVRWPVAVSAGADNSGQKNTGTGQMNAGVTLDNPLHLAEQWSLSAARNDDFSRSHRSRSLNGSLTLPTATHCGDLRDWGICLVDSLWVGLCWHDVASIAGGGGVG
ncbi:POTRA domain-containing protein [Serratia liquefaciens]|uniref:POTRA domain-containing protein n=1 Tax=Serratia liquefaciens TaxID=614 RepID=UPI0030B8DC71